MTHQQPSSENIPAKRYANLKTSVVMLPKNNKTNKFPKITW